ncbi:MAG: AI-2E family transporter [Deltaproteobacteria bacterium]|nr:AI-2E family transporter [Deltaproteobacteria bacterium]
MDKIYQNQKRAFVIFLLFLLGLFVLILKPFLLPIIVGTVLVVVFYPLYQLGLKLTGHRRYLASLFATLTVTIFLFVPGILMTSLVANQLYGVADQVVQFVNNGQLMDLLKKWDVNLQQYFTLIEQTFRIEVNLKGVAANAVKQFAYYVYQYSPSVLAQTVTFFVQGFIMLVVVYFLFIEGKGLFNEIILISPMKDAHEDALALEIRNMIYAVIYGSFMTAMVQGAMAALGFYFLGVQGFLVWGALTFLFSFIPLVGATGVWLPAAIIFFLLGEFKSGLFLTLYGALGISMVDNFLKPYFIKGRSNLHPVLLFLTILGGIALAGPIGILLGPITAAVLMASLKIYKQDYL